jgi:hypothetical protein
MIENPQRAQHWRFDLVVFNHSRAESFLNNAWRLSNISSSDRLSFLSSSPSRAEESLVRAWADSNEVHCRYIARRNRGIDYRCDYFLGECAGADNFTDSLFTFQMQDHYLDIDSPWSHWGARYDYRVKGDVVPDLILDLDSIAARLSDEGCATAFADRNNPSWFELDSKRHIAPSGANFVARTELLAQPEVQHALVEMKEVCDDTYRWAVWAEFMWGVLAFHEGSGSYDIKRDRIFREFRDDDFYSSPDDFAALHRIYRQGVFSAVSRSYYRSRRSLGRAVRKIVGSD